MIGTRLPTWRLLPVGSKPMYAETGPAANESSTPSVCWYTNPRHRSSSSTPPFVCMAQK